MENIFFLGESIIKHSGLLTKLALISLLLSIIYAAGVFIAIVRMSPDYFVQKMLTEKTRQQRHPLLYPIFKLLKNCFGICLIILGLALLLLPGQGILTILIGITFLDFPGKRRLEIWFLRRSSIRNSINRIRKKARRSPLVLPDS
jgi:hypothetical protein